MPILDQFPSEHIAGDTLRVTRSYSDYPAGTWTATLYGENRDGTFSQAATASGTDHLFTIPAATTAALKPGRYRINVRVTDGSVVETAESDIWMDIAIDPAAAGTRDVRSWARRTLDAIEATLEGRATDGQQAMSVNGRSLSRIPIPELLQMRDKLRAEVRTEEQGESAGLGRNIKIRLSRA